MAENIGFTERCIGKAQRLSVFDGLFAQALTDYLRRMGRVAYDIDRGLFWVIPPSGPPQIAVWLMPVAVQAEQA